MGEPELQVPRVGVFVCHCGLNIAGTVDCESVRDYAESLPNVAYANDLMFTCSSDGLSEIRKAITENNLNKVVVASCTPRTHEPIFREVLEEAGLNRYLFEMVNLREHVSWCHMNEKEHATEKAKTLVEMAVARAAQLEPLERESVDVIPSVAVIGGGVAGISAALDAANGGYHVYLIDSRPTIGGQMALLDKVFPQNDCAICILGPIMASVERHPEIELLTYSEVESLEGHVGSFRMRVRRKARFIDSQKCNGCGECVQECPVSVNNEYEFGLARRKAVYRPFPQAVPNTFTIEKLGVSPCRGGCPAGVRTQAFIALTREKKFDKALDVLRETYPFPGTLGRVCDHPCESKCERAEIDQPVSIRNIHRFLADYEREHGETRSVEPNISREEQIAIIGAGPAGLACAYDLSRRGYPVTIFESRSKSGGLLRWGIPEYRLPRDVLDDEISRIELLGVGIIRGKRVESTSDLFDQGFKSIFVATGAPKSRKLMIRGENAKGVHYALEFLDKVNSNKPIELGTKTVIIGGGNAAIDSARVARRLGTRQVTILYRRSRDEMPAIPSEIEEAIGEGVKIQFLTAPVEILETSGQVSGIKCITMQLGAPDASGRRRPVPVSDSEFDIDVDSVIVAVGQEVPSKGVASELELNEWGTIETDPITLQTSMQGVFAGGDVTSGGGSVIEAVAAGKRAAESIHRYINGEDMLSQRPEVLGEIAHSKLESSKVPVSARNPMPTLGQTSRRKNFREIECGFPEETAIMEANRCINCAVCSECEQCTDACKLGAIDHSMKDEIVELDIGTIIVATGFSTYEPEKTREYGYGLFPNVITNAQFERITNAAGPTHGKILRPSDGKTPKSVAFIQCVGSRDLRANCDYCCYIGCQNSLKQAIQVKEKYPATEVTVFAIDVRTHGTGYEEQYKRARRMGVVIVKGKAAELEEDFNTRNLQVFAEDLYTGMNLGLTFEMIVLASALRPQPNSPELSRKLNISIDQYGFYMCAHPKLRPAETFRDGIFVAGSCLGPMDITKAVAMGEAAAAKAQSIMAPGRFNIEPIYAEINPDECMKCELCADLCAYGAPSLVDGTMVIAKTLCQGCGTCAAGCPKHAIDMKHYRSAQILSMIKVASESALTHVHVDDKPEAPVI
jgi:heterodisulfide reductase subunit A